FFQAEDGIRDFHVTGVQTCALPISVALEQKKQMGQELNQLKNKAEGKFAELKDLFENQSSSNNISDRDLTLPPVPNELGTRHPRSEERRVGKEWRSRRTPQRRKKKR